MVILRQLSSVLAAGQAAWLTGAALPAASRDRGNSSCSHLWLKHSQKGLPPRATRMMLSVPCWSITSIVRRRSRSSHMCRAHNLPALKIRQMVWTRGASASGGRACPHPGLGRRQKYQSVTTPPLPPRGVFLSYLSSTLVCVHHAEYGRCILFVTAP